MLLGLGIILVLVVQIDPNAGVGTTLLGMTPNDDRRFQCLWKSNAPTDAGNAGRVELMEKNQFDSTDYAGTDPENATGLGQPRP